MRSGSNSNATKLRLPKVGLLIASLAKSSGGKWEKILNKIFLFIDCSVIAAVVVVVDDDVDSVANGRDS